jgi:formyl-CoA transferase
MRQTPQLVAWMEEEGMSDDILRRINWSDFDWGSTSAEDGDRIQDCFARFFKAKTKAELLEGAIKRDVMIQPFATPEEVMNHPQLKVRDYWAEVEYPHLGMSLRYPSRSCIPSEAPCKTWRPAPLIGEHNQEILSGELGLSAEDLSVLKQAGVI